MAPGFPGMHLVNPGIREWAKGAAKARSQFHFSATLVGPLMALRSKHGRSTVRGARRHAAAYGGTWRHAVARDGTVGARSARGRRLV